MLTVILKKCIFLLFAFFSTITLTFFLMKAIPGDPFTNKKAIPKEILEAMAEHYDFNKPIWQQYVKYIHSALHGDLGPSFKYKGRTVKSIIESGVAKSMILGLQALLVSLIGGFSFGLYSALRKKTPLFFLFSTSIFICIPSFLLAAILQYVFAIQFSLFPVARWVGFVSTILPTLALAALPFAFIAKLTYNTISALQSSDALLLAKSKGIGPMRLILVYYLPAAMTPVISYLGFDLASILAGSFIVEKIFAIPGIGYALVTAVLNRDYTVIMGMTIFYSILFLTAIFLADILVLWLNPKCREKQYV